MRRVGAIYKLIKPLSLTLVFICFGLVRLLILPGVSFNQTVWDDEIGWIGDSKNKSTFDYITYRDAPGYYVFIPRMIILLGSNLPSIGTIETLRLVVLVVQFVCLICAVSCIVAFNKNWKFSLLLLSSLAITYIEDLNYVHNVGYLFIFPIFCLIFKPISERKSISLLRLGIAALLISKPFTAVIILALIALFILSKTTQVRKLLFLGLYCISYLGTYLILPNRWDTPFNYDFTTLFKMAFNLPWVIFASLNPLVAIGGLGFLRLHDLRSISILVGIFVYLLLGFYLIRKRRTIFMHIGNLTLMSKSLVSIFLINYLMVYSSNDSFWMKYFPLFRLDEPRFLWARWSAVIPLSALLIIASLNFLSIRAKFLILYYVILQWIVLIALAYPWLLRYW